MEVRGVKAQWHSTSPFHPQPLIHHDKCAQMIRPSSTNGERRERTSFAQDPLQLIHPALLWANWSGALPACVLLIHPTQFKRSCSQRSHFLCVCVCVGRGGVLYVYTLCQRAFWGYRLRLGDHRQKKKRSHKRASSVRYHIFCLISGDDSKPALIIWSPSVAKFKYICKCDGILCLKFCLCTFKTQNVLYIIY